MVGFRSSIRVPLRGGLFNTGRERAWKSAPSDSRDFLVMGNPFETYNDEVERFLEKPRTTGATEHQL
jgi:hypothetical protein